MEKRYIGFERFGAIILTVFCCLMPVFYVPFVRDGYYLPKVTLLYLADVLLLAALIKHKAFGKIHKLFYGGKPVAFALIYGAAVLISSVLAMDVKTAFFGSIFRLEGAVTICAYIILFWFSVRLSDSVCKYNYFKFFIFCASLASLYGILQRHGIEILPIDSRRALWQNQAFSTFGNPNFFGSFLCLSLPLAAVLFIKKGGGFLGVASAIQAYALLCSETQGAWIGALAAFIIIFLYFIFKGTSDEKKRLLILTTVTFAIIAVYQLEFNTVVSEIRSVIRDLSALFKLIFAKGSYKSAASGGRYRVFIWQYSLKLIKKFPFLGVGPECMNIAINRYFAVPGVFRYDLLRIIDRAHNEYLHTAVSSGVFAAVMYMMIIASCVRRGIMSLKVSAENGVESDGYAAERDVRLGVIIGVLAYSVQAFFNISVVSVAPMFWIFLGVLAGGYSGENKIKIKIKNVLTK